MRTVIAAVVAAGWLAHAPAAAQAPEPTPTPDAADASDYFKTAGNFARNCDARPDASGERPPESYPCLSYMAGLIEGYTTAALANGNPRPYCLPRPVTLVEMMDLMVTAIERGAPDTLPTATVFHFILSDTFACEPAAEPTPQAE